MKVYVDHTHLGRHVTGIERITAELFAPHSLAPVELVPVTAHGTLRMTLTQTFGLPLRMTDPSAVLLCPGFPPSPLLLPFAARVVPYIHDVFLMTRRSDLNTRAKLYMAKPFALAVRRYPRFLVNSLDTARKLRSFCRSDAQILPYRPRVRNVFGVDPTKRAPRSSTRPLRLLSIGTVEPRKNYGFSAQILRELRRNGFADATLEIVGRNGWGGEQRALEQEPGVILTGYLSADEVRRRLLEADALLCTSHEEGLGLPLLEAQYAGLPVIAPDDAIFREVLGTSGIFIDRNDGAVAAGTIASTLLPQDAATRYLELNARNLDRWNRLADDDRHQVAKMIASLAEIDTQPAEARPVATSGRNSN
jgi:glycosyltransferase involved in cell wall biosynthesis